MAQKVAVINMKGGVGKSTVSANLAWHFCGRANWSKKVLAADLDPQFNLSQYILGVHSYDNVVVKGNNPTMWDIFEQNTRAPGIKARGKSLSDCIVKRVKYHDGAQLDLIPSQLQLSSTLKNPSQKEHLLSTFMSKCEKDYDVIFVDCAPTESVLTVAAYLACDWILIPVKPEFLCTIGLPLIQESLNEFDRIYGKRPKVAGVCFNGCSDYSPEESLAKTEVKALAAKFGWHVFEREIPFSRSFARGAREGTPIFQTSYSRSIVSSKVGMFCEEFAMKIGL